MTRFRANTACLSRAAFLNLGIQNDMKYIDATSIFETIPDSGGAYFSEIDNNPLDSCNS